MWSRSDLCALLACCACCTGPALAATGADIGADIATDPGAARATGTVPGLAPDMAAGSATAPAIAPAPIQAADMFYSRINVLTYATGQRLGESFLNPGNVQMIPRYQAALEVRPDFNLNLGRFEFGLKPRLEYAASQVDSIFSAGPAEITSAVFRQLSGNPWFDGYRIGDWLPHANGYASHSRTFINEGYARYHITDRLLAVAGRENLQWGPSSLLSPSNPFNANNGRNNPNLELPGLDYVRLVAIPNPALTMSLIANTGPGRMNQNGPFENAYAAKLDYTGDGHYFSVIVSERAHERRRLGLFGGWNASDALLLYIEGSAAKKSTLPFSTSDYQVLVGGAYTLEAGPTLTLEYFHNNAGCSANIVLCLLQQIVTNTPPTPLLRKRYALLQYVDTRIGGKLNLALRLIRNLDDHSGVLVANLEYELGQHWQLDVVPTLYRGGSDSEFGGLLRRSIFFGASYTF